jgi:hypothetical protein
MVKIYVDSRKRSGGTSDTDFSFQPPQSIQLDQQLCHIDTVLLPHTWYLVRTGETDELYVREDYANGFSTTITYRIVQLGQGQYDGISLAVAVALALNTGTTLVDAGATPYQVSFNSSTSKLEVSTTTGNGGGFAIYPQELLKTDLATTWNANVQPGMTRSVDSLHTANKICGFLGLTAIAADSLSSPAYGDSVVDCLAYHQVFIHANFGMPGESIGPNGEGSIVRRVVVTAPPSGLIVDRFTTSWDFIKVGARSLRSMSFRIADIDGKTINTNGHHVSFSVIFT